MRTVSRTPAAASRTVPAAPNVAHRHARTRGLGVAASLQDLGRHAPRALAPHPVGHGDQPQLRELGHREGVLVLVARALRAGARHVEHHPVGADRPRRCARRPTPRAPRAAPGPPAPGGGGGRPPGRGRLRCRGTDPKPPPPEPTRTRGGDRDGPRPREIAVLLRGARRFEPPPPLPSSDPLYGSVAGLPAVRPPR